MSDRAALATVSSTSLTHELCPTKPNAKNFHQKHGWSVNSTSDTPPRPFLATATPFPATATPLLPQRQRPSQNLGLTGPKASVHPTATSCRASVFQHQSEQNSAKLYFHNPIIPPHFSITRISGRYAAFILVLSEKVPTPQKCPRSAASRSMHPPNS